MGTYQNSASDAKRFFEDFIVEYYEKRNYEKCLSVMAPDISWYGTGAHEVCYSLDDAIRLFSEEKSSFDASLTIIKQDIHVTSVASGVYALCSTSTFKDTNELSLYLQEMDTRISVICHYQNGSFLVKHIHVSVPNLAQSEGEFVQKVTDSNYDKLLEQTLEKRTKLLRKTTSELEALTNNICGGVIICKCDSNFTISYMSDGFTALTGYTKDVLHTKFNDSHLAIVYEKDKANFAETYAEINEKDEYVKVYTSEYRIVHKDGHQIWVLDNSIKLKGEECDTYQCILTDITTQKSQEFELRMSEKRYEIAMGMSDIVMFEYNIITRQLLLFEQDTTLYSVNNVVEEGVQTFIKNGIIEPDSVDAFRGMYDLIHAGAKTASCIIRAKDVMGVVHDYELQLNTVFDDDGRPISAIGLRKNVSKLHRLEKEREFANTLVSDKIFLVEADITNNVVVDMSEYWKSILNITIGTPLSHALDLVCEKYIDPEYREAIRRRTSYKYIKQKYEKGERLIVFTYKRKDELGALSWFEGTINIIRDAHNDTLHMRFYHTNINDRKAKEQRVLEDQRLYANFTSRAKLAYEVNITKNLALKGHENWEEVYGIAPTENYSDMISAFAICGLYAEDAQVFVDCFEAENVKKAFKNGKRQIECQYRKPTEDGELHWVCCTLNLYEDPITEDIKGYSFVEDIDEKMRAELTLKYKAEHDTMTGLFNKVTTQAVIEAFLADETYALKQHAFLIIDIDFFKSINDTFGHLFGDDVLRDVSVRIKAIFREDDIIGRVGGDEFVVLMKKVSGVEIVAQKAQEICDQLKISYRNGQSTASISASVGIAMYPKGGVNYAALFSHADIALYSSKNSGKNNYAF